MTDLSSRIDRAVTRRVDAVIHQVIEADAVRELPALLKLAVLSLYAFAAVHLTFLVILPLLRNSIGDGLGSDASGLSDRERAALANQFVAGSMSLHLMLAAAGVTFGSLVRLRAGSAAHRVGDPRVRLPHPGVVRAGPARRRIAGSIAKGRELGIQDLEFGMCGTNSKFRIPNS